jgi:hypothetical protein
MRNGGFVDVFTILISILVTATICAAAGAGWKAGLNPMKVAMMKETLRTKTSGHHIAGRTCGSTPREQLDN